MGSSRTCTGITQTYTTIGVKIKLDEFRAQNNDWGGYNTVACSTDSIPAVQGIAWRRFFNVDFRFMVAAISVAASVVLAFLIYQTYTDSSGADMDAGDINAGLPDAYPKTAYRAVTADTVAGSGNNSRDVNLRNDLVADPELRSTAMQEKPGGSKVILDDELMKPLLKLVTAKDFARALEFMDKNMPVLSGDETSKSSSIRRTIGELSRLNDVLVKALEDRKPGFKISFMQAGILCEGELLSCTGNELWVRTAMDKNKIKTRIALDALSPDTVISLAGGSISREALMISAYLRASELGDAISSGKYLDLSQGALSGYLKGSMRIARNSAD
jgi:hypothetical protein